MCSCLLLCSDCLTNCHKPHGVAISMVLDQALTDRITRRSSCSGHVFVVESYGRCQRNLDMLYIPRSRFFLDDIIVNTESPERGSDVLLFGST